MANPDSASLISCETQTFNVTENDTGPGNNLAHTVTAISGPLIATVVGGNGGTTLATYIYDGYARPTRIDRANNRDT